MQPQDSITIFRRQTTGDVKSVTLPGRKEVVQRLFPDMVLPDSMTLSFTSVHLCYVNEMESEGIFMFTEADKPRLYATFGLRMANIFRRGHVEFVVCAWWGG